MPTYGKALEELEDQDRARHEAAEQGYQAFLQSLGPDDRQAQLESELARVRDGLAEARSFQDLQAAVVDTGGVEDAPDPDEVEDRAQGPNATARGE